MTESKFSIIGISDIIMGDINYYNGRYKLL